MTTSHGHGTEERRQAPVPSAGGSFRDRLARWMAAFHTAQAEPASTHQVLTALRAPVSPLEVDWLWSFIHGDIMEPGIREQLNRAYGLCSRHAWWVAAVEMELWKDDLGPRPLDACVYGHDLLGYTRSRLTAPHFPSWQKVRKVMRGEGDCRICAAVANSLRQQSLERAPRGFDAATLERDAEEANRLVNTREWLRRTEPVWRVRVCPICESRIAGTRLPGPGHLCRPHLLEGCEPEGTVKALTDYLGDVQWRIAGLIRSMTPRAVPPTLAQEASWIEEIAWFAGWWFPFWITSSGSSSDPLIDDHDPMP